MLRKFQKWLTKHMPVVLLTFLLPLICTLLWNQVPQILSPLWIRYSAQTLQRLLALSLLLLLYQLAYIVYLLRKAKTPKGNYFSDLRVVRDSNNELGIEVWYFYDGSLGEKDIYIDVDYLDRRGNLLPYGGSLGGMEITIVGHKALARLDSSPSINSQPTAPQESTYIQLSMYHEAKGTFYRQKFPYRKTWTLEVKP